MSDNVYKKVEITGTSSRNINEAVNNAIAKAAETVRNMRWFEVVETRGTIDDNKVGQWQVTLKVGFRIGE